MTYVIHDNRGYVTGLSLDPDDPLAFDPDPYLAAQYENLGMAQNDAARLFPGSAVLDYHFALRMWNGIRKASSHSRP